MRNISAAAIALAIMGIMNSGANAATETVLYAFTGAADGAIPEAGLDV